MNESKILKLTIHFFIAAVLLFGCSQSYVRQGETALKHSEHRKAIDYFQAQLSQNPSDPRALSGLGRAYYHLKEYDNALKMLTTAESLKPNDPLVLLFLGMTQEAREDFDAAAARYERYLARFGTAKNAEQVRGRLLYVRNEELRRQVREAVKTEQSLGEVTTGEKTVGVLPFVVPEDADETTRALAEGLAAVTWFDLASVEGLTVVERLQVKYLLQELKIAEEGLTTEASAPRVGRIVRAGQLVNVGVDRPMADRVSLNGALVRTQTEEGAFSPTYSGADQLRKVMSLQKDLALATLDSLGIRLRGSQLRDFKKPATESYQSFLDFGRGIEHLDRGEYGRARSFFEQAVRLDPRFALASSLGAQARALEQGGVSLDHFGQTVAVGVGTDAGRPFNPLQDVRGISAPRTDPRFEDLPARPTGSATVSGTID